MYINKNSNQINKSNSSNDSNSEDTSSKNNSNNNDNNNENNNNINLPRLNEPKEKKYSFNFRNNVCIEFENSKTTHEEEISIVNSLWDELGITEEYKHNFNQILKRYNSYNTSVIFFQEKENLQKFKTSLLKLKKEISSRETNITNLKKIIKKLDENKNLNLNSNSDLINEIINIIKNLRLNAINIVIYINKVRELSFYYYFQGKFDLTKIKNEYIYNNNYLLQMNQDLNFLKLSSINNYIYFGDGPCDAFLVNCSQLNENNKSDKIIIPITDDIKQLIEKSIFFIFQDEILDNIYLKKFMNANKNNNTNNMNRSNSMKLKINHDLNRPLTSKGFFYNENNNCMKPTKKNMNLNNFFINDFDKRLLNNYKKGKIFDNNNMIYQISAKLNEPRINLLPESTRIKNRFKNQNDISKYNNISDQKKIEIIREKINLMNLNSKNKNKTYIDNINNINNINNKKDNHNQIIKNEFPIKLNKKTGEKDKEKDKIRIIKSIFN